MVTRKRIWFSRRCGKSPAGVKTENHLTWPGVAQFLPNDFFHENGVGVETLQDSLLLLEARSGSGQLRCAGGLILLQLVIFCTRLEKKRAGADPECSQEDDVKKGDEAARDQGS
jgi:hypothetical protein